MTAFSGIILAIYCTIIFIYKDIKKIFIYSLAFSVAVLINVNMGYFIKIGGHEVSYVTFIMLYLTTLSIITLFKLNVFIRLNDVVWLGILTTFLLVNIISMFLYTYDKPIIVEGTSWDYYFFGWENKSVLDPYNVSFLGYIVLFIELIIVCCVVKLLLGRQDFIKITELIKKISCFFLLVAILEFLEKNIFKTLNISDIIIKLCGYTDDVHDYLDINNGIVAVQGFTKEKSMFSYSVFLNAFILVVEKIGNVKQKNSWMLIIMYFFFLAVNQSLSGLLYILILLFLYFVYDFKFCRFSKIRVFILLLSISLILLLLKFLVIESLMSSNNELLKRIGRTLILIFDYSQYGQDDLIITSEYIRISSIYECIGLFLDRPILGLGLASTHCYSGVVTFLSNVGLLGLLFIGGYYYYLLYSIEIKIRNIKTTKVDIDIILAMLLLWILPNLMANNLYTMINLVNPIVLMCFVAAMNKNRGNSFDEVRRESI